LLTHQFSVPPGSVFSVASAWLDENDGLVQVPPVGDLVVVVVGGTVAVFVGGGFGRVVVVVVGGGVAFAQFTVSDLALTFVKLRACGQVIVSEFPARSARVFVTPDALTPRSRTVVTAKVAMAVMRVLFICPPAG
jgi:hypothetical protein